MLDPRSRPLYADHVRDAQNDVLQRYLIYQDDTREHEYDDMLMRVGYDQQACLSASQGQRTFERPKKARVRTLWRCSGASCMVARDAYEFLFSGTSY